MLQQKCNKNVKGESARHRLSAALRASQTRSPVTLIRLSLDVHRGVEQSGSSSGS